MKTILITARVDQNVCDQIEFLKKELEERTTTNILTKAVKCLYDSVKQQECQKSPFEMLEELDLIGCFDGEVTLSTDYKKALICHGDIVSTDARDFKTYRWKNHHPFRNLQRID